MKLSVITDEFTQDVDEAVALAMRYCLDALEIRSINNKGLFELTERDAKSIAARIASAGLKVSALCSPFFKCALHNDAEVEAHIAGLRRCIRLAGIFQTALIRGFPFWRVGSPIPLEMIATRFRTPARMLEDTGLSLALESDPNVNACNAGELAAVLDAIDEPQIGALWDTGNSLFAPEYEKPYPDGYEKLKKRIIHVHLKDAIRDHSGRAAACRLTDGQADISGQLRALQADGYTGYLSLETHYRKHTALSESAMRLPGGNSFSEGGDDPVCECLDMLCALTGRFHESIGKEYVR